MKRPPALHLALAGLGGCATHGNSSGGDAERRESNRASTSGAKTAADVEKLMSEAERANDRRD